MDEILWHRRESRRQTEKTNIVLESWKSPAYSKIGNSPQGNPDYTFRANAEEYKLKRLIVLVRPIN